MISASRLRDDVPPDFESAKQKEIPKTEPVALPRILGAKGNNGGYMLRQDEKEKSTAQHSNGSGRDVANPKQKTKGSKGICACGGKSGMVSDPADEALEEEETSKAMSSLSCNIRRSVKADDLQVTRLTIRPRLSLVNAALTTNMFDRRAWKEVQLPSMVGVNVYDLPAANGVELRGRLGDDAETPWSSSILVRATALHNSAEMQDLDLKQSPTGAVESLNPVVGAAAGIVAQPMGAGRVRMSCPRLFTHRLVPVSGIQQHWQIQPGGSKDDLKQDEEVRLFSDSSALGRYFDVLADPLQWSPIAQDRRVYHAPEQL
eukprot:Skav227615  [mRNA]  locus=scaffold1141:637823:642589:- [translate_table: standard]